MNEENASWKDHLSEFAQTFFDANPQPFQVYRADGVLLGVNQAHERMWGIKREKWVGTYNPLEDPQILKQSFPELFQRALAGETVSGEPLLYDAAVIRPEEAEAKTLWVRTTLFPLPDESGKITKIGVTGADVTEEIEKNRAIEAAEARLRDSEKDLRIFQAVVENAPDGFSIGNLKGDITYSNRSYNDLLGHEDSVGLNMNDVAAPEEETRLAEITRILEEKGAWVGVYHYKRKDGSTFVGQTSSFIVADEQGKPQAMATIVRDITEQRQAEEERTQLQQQIIEAQKASLRELSTPLMPLANRVVAMPLVGSIDSRRAQDVMETLLQGVADYHATVAILDITGVQVVDTQVANTLVRTAQAVKLIGAQVVITGIGPAMAQTLVQLGADLSGIVTRGSLQAGIEYALGRSHTNV